MNTTEGLSFRAMNEKRGSTAAPAVAAVTPAATLAREDAPAQEPAPAPTPAGSSLPFDPWRLAAALLRNTRWVILCGILCAALGFGLGLLRFHNLYVGSASLIRQELPNSFQVSETGESFKPKQLTVGTLVSVLHSPALLKKVSEQTHGAVTPGMLALKMTVTPERNTDVIRLDYEGWSSAEATANVLGIYSEAVVQLTRDLQAEEAVQVSRVLTQQLQAIDVDLTRIGRQMLDYSREAQLVSADKETDAYLHQLGDLSLKYETMRIDFETSDLKLASLETELARHNPVAAKLQEARAELNNMLVRYTEANPAVAEQRGKVESIEKEMEEAVAHPGDDSQLANSTAGTSLYLEIVELKAQKQTLSRQLEKLGKVRDDLQAKLTALPEKSVQLAKMKARQQSLETAQTILGSRQREAQMFAENAPGLLRVFAVPTALDVSIKSRWTKVLLVAFALGALGAFGATGLILARELLDERIKTAHDFSRISKLPVVLRVPPLAEIAPAEAQQWAFRAWTSLSSSLRVGPGGALVLGVLADGRGGGCSTLLYQLAGAAAQRGHNVVVVANREPLTGEMPQAVVRHALGEALGDPRRVFAAHDPVGTGIHLLAVDAAWRWTAELRRQWAATLAAWRSVRSLVVLFEMPAGADPEALLLAETIPNLLCVGSEASSASALRVQLATLRESHCNLVGAAFNQRQSLPGLAWLGKWAVVLAIGALSLAQAGAAEAPQASWQQRLTLGAGDTVNLSFFGHAEWARTDVPIGPDGNISYLEAHDIPAAGHTIDEIRASLDAALGKLYHNARTIVTPGLIQSKRYYILGKVVDKGVFTLDRPMTILEAVAKSRGLETGLFEKNTVELADLPRAFLSRRGQRMPVDFERLFQQGDMSQNLPLEPEDYIYFPSSNTNEVYVLGDVKSPGVQGFTPNATVISMATVRGGFTEKAYLDRVLVIRGSLNHPQTFVVDVRKVLKGRGVDFALQPKDIVFVADRPWARAEELVDVALRTFVQAAAAGWATGNVGPLINTPLLPNIR